MVEMKEDVVVIGETRTLDVPVIIKYMGSKKPILDFITSNIRGIHRDGNIVCDLFAGSCSISAGLRNEFDFISNDIQEYSRTIGQTYFSDFSGVNLEKLMISILNTAQIHYSKLSESLNGYIFDYGNINTLEEFYRIEEKQRDLFKMDIATNDYNLFTKFYSGTYWSCEQCIWIDSLRKAADDIINITYRNVILSSIMFAMANTSQSTGHFAQYRDGHSHDSMLNIIIYRQKGFLDSFKKKLTELLSVLRNPVKSIVTTTQDFTECLSHLPENITVYADPPYAPVHYSRFYHALETLIKYDYPKLEFKGRYRMDRHQSPFSQKTKAIQAFEDLFDGIISKRSQMLLTYSNGGVVEIGQLITLARKKFGKEYIIDLQEFDHIHSTMGKADDARRDVVEHLIIAKLK